MDELVRKIKKKIEENNLIRRGESVVVGVSGGADSMALFYVLLSLREMMAITLTVVHIHHGLRGEAADGDRDFTAAVCQRENVDFICYETDIRALAAEKHMSEEEAGRMYRYECFEAVRLEKHADRIAVAHHMDDMAETVLMNLFRGSGIKGIAGIPAARGSIVRPLLSVSRREIEDYLERNHIAYRTDATNFETDYTRNKLRLDVLPYIRENINTSATEHIAETAMLAADIAEYMEDMAEKAAEHMVLWEDDQCRIETHTFLIQNRAIQREVLRLCMRRMASGLKDVGMVHIESLRQLFAGESGRRISLPYRLYAVRNYDHVKIGHEQDLIRSRETAEGEIAVNVPGEYSVADSRFQVEVSEVFAEKKMQIPKNLYTKWFDYDKIKGTLILRHRREGDYMMIMNGHKKALRRILMDDRVPKEDRDSLYLLAENDHVLWVPKTGRISEYYKINNETKRVLQARLKENKDERER